MWYLIVSIPDLCNLTYFVNIAIGKIAQDNVNVDKAVELGSKQIKELKMVGLKLSRVVKTQV